MARCDQMISDISVCLADWLAGRPAVNRRNFRNRTALLKYFHTCPSVSQVLLMMPSDKEDFIW